MHSVYPINVDGDAAIEIITAEDFWDGTRYHSQLRIWNYTNGNLYLENSIDWFLAGGGNRLYSTYALDIDGDSAIEILTAGYANDGTRDNSQLRIWNYTNGNLLLENSTDWYLSGNAHVHLVYPINIDGDSAIEILTAGYASDGTRANGQLRIWNYTNGNLYLENSTQWYLSGDTIANSIYPINIDGDAATEILTTGTAWDGTRWNGQLRIWNYTAG